MKSNSRQEELCLPHPIPHLPATAGPAQRELWKLHEGGSTVSSLIVSSNLLLKDCEHQEKSSHSNQEKTKTTKSPGIKPALLTKRDQRAAQQPASVNKGNTGPSTKQLQADSRKGRTVLPRDGKRAERALRLWRHFLHLMQGKERSRAAGLTELRRQRSELRDAEGCWFAGQNTGDRAHCTSTQGPHWSLPTPSCTAAGHDHRRLGKHPPGRS